MSFTSNFHVNDESSQAPSSLPLLSQTPSSFPFSSQALGLHLLFQALSIFIMKFPCLIFLHYKHRCVFTRFFLYRQFEGFLFLVWFWYLRHNKVFITNVCNVLNDVFSHFDFSFFLFFQVLNRFFVLFCFVLLQVLQVFLFLIYFVLLQFGFLSFYLLQ